MNIAIVVVLAAINVVMWPLIVKVAIREVRAVWAGDISA